MYNTRLLSTQIATEHRGGDSEQCCVSQTEGRKAGPVTEKRLYTSQKHMSNRRRAGWMRFFRFSGSGEALAQVGADISGLFRKRPRDAPVEFQ